MTANSDIQENLLRVQEKIVGAALRAGRRPEDVLLIGVSKTHPAETIRDAYEAGLRHFGENRVQEWEGKLPLLSDLQATWHLIGHLQSNKAARATKVFDCLDSIDDWSLAQRVDRAQGEKKSGGKLRVLVEVHLGGEDSKSGVAEAELAGLAERVLGCGHLQLAGLMCIPPFMENPEQVRPYFAALRKLKDQLEMQFAITLPVLSMGMSHDFEVAIQEGATEVRVGTAICGTRAKQPVIQ